MPGLSPFLVPLLADRRQEWLPAVLVGAGLIGLGAWFLASHLTTWAAQRNDPALDSHDRNYYRRQFRRRMQASGMLVLIGLLVPLGDSVIPWPAGNVGLVSWACYWLFVLGLTGWVLVLALGDLAATRTHGSSAMARLHQKQRELEAEADRLRAGQRPASRNSELDP